MNHELESKYYPVCPKSIRKSLRSLGAKRIRIREVMKRVLYEIDKESNKFMVVLDRGSKITLSVHEITDEGARRSEACVEATTMRAITELMGAIGLKNPIIQETAREEWRLVDEDGNNTTIFIDWWPGLRPIVHISGRSEQSIIESARHLFLANTLLFSGDMTDLYGREMGLTKDEFQAIPLLSFRRYPSRDINGNPTKDFMPARIRY